MKVFISSLIANMGPMRRAARDAVEALGYQPVMAEDFGARPSSPQIACLNGLRQADIVVLILGESYGTLQQPSGLSATHEEYREAKDRKPVLAFVQTGISPEPDQAVFISEVQSWEGGLFRGGFTTPEDLRPAITRALHEWQLANAVGPLDPSDLLKRALALVPSAHRNSFAGTASLSIAVAGGPTQSVIRPAQIEDPVLAEALLKEALFGKHRIFDPGKGSSTAVVGHALVLEQERHATALSLDEQGSMLIELAVERSSYPHGLPVLIEEDIRHRIAAGLGFAGELLERIDPTQRLTHVAIAAKIHGAGFLAWRTRREHDASPDQLVGGSFPFGNDERATVHLTPAHRPRAALRVDASRLVEDLVVLLRRQWKS
jgi:hypothetical protein